MQLQNCVYEGLNSMHSPVYQLLLLVWHLVLVGSASALSLALFLTRSLLCQPPAPSGNDL